MNVAGDATETINRPLSPLGTRIQRFVLHSLLAVGLGVEKWRGTVAGIVLGVGARGKNRFDLAVQAMRVRIKEDWDALRSKTLLMDTDLAFAIYLCFPMERKGGAPFAWPDSLRSPQGRDDYERNFARNFLDPVFQPQRGTTVAARIEKEKSQLGTPRVVQFENNALGS
eukprot:SAG31_NODE_10808_length_1094_cov_2.040235_1_plen_169_part_00